MASCEHAEVWDLGTVLSSGWKEGLEKAFLLPFSEFLGRCGSWVAFSGDGTTLAVTNDRTVTLYDLTSHRVRASYAITALVVDAAFTPDLSRAAFSTVHGLLPWEVGKVKTTGGNADAH